MFMDGTSKTVTIDKKIAVNGTETDVNKAADITGNKFYTYKTDKGGNYELTEVTDSTSAKIYQAKAEKSFITDAPKSIHGVNASANSKTTYIAKDKVYTGDEETLPRLATLRTRSTCTTWSRAAVCTWFTRH